MRRLAAVAGLVSLTALVRTPSCYAGLSNGLSFNQVRTNSSPSMYMHMHVCLNTGALEATLYSQGNPQLCACEGVHEWGLDRPMITSRRLHAAQLAAEAMLHSVYAGLQASRLKPTGMSVLFVLGGVTSMASLGDSSPLELHEFPAASTSQ